MFLHLQKCVFFALVEGKEVGRAEMTAVQQPPLTGDAGLHWDANNIIDSDLDEDDETNSAKLFERSRIRALAGMSLRHCHTFESHGV